MPPGRPRSIAWDYFEKPSIAPFKTIYELKCKICDTVLKYSVRCTTNLLDHLENKHKIKGNGRVQTKYKAHSVLKSNLVENGVRMARRKSQTLLSADRNCVRSKHQFPGKFIFASRKSCISINLMLCIR